MGLETGTRISNLNASWPTGSDPKSEGDDHFRLLKNVLKNDVVPAAVGGTFKGDVTLQSNGAQAPYLLFDKTTNAAGEQRSGIYLDGEGDLNVARMLDGSGFDAVTHVFERDGSLSAGNSIANRAGGDTRWARLDAINTFVAGQIIEGGLTVDPGADGDSVFIGENNGSRAVTFTRTDLATPASILLGNGGHVFMSTGEATGEIRYNGTYPATASAGATVLSRQMGDNRYAPVAVMLGLITALRDSGAITLEIADTLEAGLSRLRDDA